MSQGESSQVRIELSRAERSAAGGSSVAPGPGPSQPDDRTVISDRLPIGSGVNPAAPPQPSELNRLVAGDRLGHFELVEYVGGGGMGAVFRARDTMLDRDVALKVLSRTQSADDEARRRFHVEAQSAARLDHQNIARVYYVGEDQGLNFIAFEFIQGVNIRDLVDRAGPLTLEDAVSYTLQIAEALAHSNSRNVIHRDIKPSNIIVTDEGQAKLVDMGLARMHANTGNEDLTASGVTLGTFDYISPEQARDPRMADVRSDIYSLGCTLYYMLTARPPFPDGTVLQKLLQHQADDVPDPRQFNADVPVEVAALLRRMLAKDPRRRFQDPGELIGELLVLSDRLDLRPVASGRYLIAADPDRRALWERHLPWVAPVAALLLIAVAAQWFETTSSLAPPAEVDSPRANPDMSTATPARSGDLETSQIGTGVARQRDEGKHHAANDDAVAPSGARAPAEPDVERTRRALADSSIDRLTANSSVAENGSLPDETDSALSGAGAADSIARSDESTVEISPEPRRAPSSTVVDNEEFDPPPSTSLPKVAARSAPAAPTTTTSQGTLRSSSSAPSATGVTILARDGQEAIPFATLQGACSAARNNDVIELAFNGPRAEEPFELTNLKLTIRAAEGYRPVIAFAPGHVNMGGFGRSMITVAGGRLSLFNVGLQLEIPRDATAAGWSLFETRQAEQLRFEGCVLSIRNPSPGNSGFHEDIAFFNVKAAPGVDTMMHNPDAPPVHPVNLDLQNCIARGEAVFIQTADAQPVALEWDNGLLAISEPLLLAEGTSATAPLGARVEINLNHLTAITQGGLIRLLAAADSPYLLKTEVTCANSFLMTREAPLVEQQGPQRTAVLEQQFQWSGDRNFCQGFSVFWKMVDLNAQTVPRLISWPQWQTLMGQGDKLLSPDDRIWRRSPGDDRAMHSLRREDFVIADRLRLPGGAFDASDAGEVGMEARKLPDVSADVPPATPRDAQRRSSNPSRNP